MKPVEVSRATIGRIPTYLKYLKTVVSDTENISATTIARALGLGDVQVRKDLSAVSGAGRPRTGYNTRQLIASLEAFLGNGVCSRVVIVGAGKLGRALLDYGGFHDYGLEIVAAFDKAVTAPQQSNSGKPILPMTQFDAFCRECPVKIGIVTVPADAAQEACDRLLAVGVGAIWCFAPCTLRVPEGFPVQYENMALSLAYLNKRIGDTE